MPRAGSSPRCGPHLAGIDAELAEVDVTSVASVERAFDAVGPVELLVYNAGRIDLARLAETTPEMFEASFRVNAFGAFVCARAAAPAMIERARGSMVFVGATSSLRGSPRTHAFAASKHALRGLAHALAKELGPGGVHVAHLVLDGKIFGPRTLVRFPNATRERCLDADAVAASIATLVEQPRSAWTFEMDLRPDTETWS